MDAAVEPHLRVGDATVDARDAALLRAVAEHGSLNAAADALDRSYSRAHSRVADLEDALGPLVERERGGAGGGGSRPTDRARELLDRYERLRAVLADTAGTETVAVEGTVADRTGRLATVETPAGEVRALLDEPVDRVRVTVRADAVTLHDPSAAPAAADTSARNRFEGTVAAVDRDEATATVAVDVGVPTPLAVRVTTTSLDRLDLAPGDPVVASVKATATRAVPVADGAD